MWNGVSGIKVHDRALNVVANNSTNTNVYGYKPDEVSFADLLYSSDGTGKGTQVSSVRKVLNQGDIELTNNPYDVAIDGKGYFVLFDQSSQETYYSRAGNFQMGDDGLLQTPDGKKVYGLQPEPPIINSTDVNTTEFNEDYINFIASSFVNSHTDYYQSINARATDYESTATDIGTSGNGFKSRSTLINEIDMMIVDYRNKLNSYIHNAMEPATDSTIQIKEFNFGTEVGSLTTENDFIRITIGNEEITQYFDTDAQTTLRKFTDKVSDIEGLTASVDSATGVVTVETTIPGESVKISEGVINNKLVFATDVQDATVGTGLGMVNSSRDALIAAIQSAGGEFLEIRNNISLTQQENLDNLDTIQLKLENMSLSENTFGTISIEENGLVFLADGDNKFVVGKVQTVAFRGEQDLDPIGGNLFRQSAGSGDPYFAGDLNKVIYNSLELSNANLSDSLATILGLQRAFEASAKTITTSDELLKTAIQLKNS